MAKIKSNDLRDIKKQISSELKDIGEKFDTRTINLIKECLVTPYEDEHIDGFDKTLKDDVIVLLDEDSQSDGCLQIVYSLPAWTIKDGIII